MEQRRMTSTLRRMRIVAIGMLCFASLLAAPGTAGKTLPDLRVASTSFDAFEVDQGAELQVAVQVTNGGKASATASTVRAYLSDDPKKDSSDVRIGAKRIGKLRSGASTTAPTSVSVPSTTPSGMYSLLVCADDTRSVKESRENNNCSLAEIRVTIPTDSELIQQAVAAGTVSADQGLVYELLSVFGDPRLPERFNGADAVDDGVATLREVADRYESLSQELKSQVDPFFVPPAYGGSWFDRYEVPSKRISGSPGIPSALPKATWTSLDSGTNVKVWWHQSQSDHASVAQSVLSEAEDTIWPKLQALMGAPLSDGHLPAGGGDGRLDLYLAQIPPEVQKNKDGLAVTVPFLGCGKSPSYVILDPTHLTNNADPGTLAHELMHVFQNRFGVKSCSAYNWLFEATGEWAIDHVYRRTVQAEHSNALNYLVRPGVSIDKNDAYGSYLFPFFIAGEGSSQAAKIRAIWDAAGTKDPFAAIEGAAGSLRELWPRFAAANWNHGGETTYNKWDGLSAGAVPYGTTPPAPGGSVTADAKVIDGASRHNLNATVAPVAAHYHWYRFTDRVRHITLTHPFTAPSDASVQAMLKVKGTWKPFVDWTGQQKHEFCRDDPTEDVSEIVIAIANSSPTAKLKPPDSTELKTRSSCDPGSWSGTFSGTANEDWDIRSWHGQVTWKREPPDPEYPRNAEYYAEGSVTFEVTNTFDCDGTYTVRLVRSQDINEPEEGGGDLGIHLGNATLKPNYDGHIDGGEFWCDAPDFAGYEPAGMAWLETGYQEFDLDSDVISGSHRADGQSWEWTFSRS